MRKIDCYMANPRPIIPGDIYADCDNEFYKVHYLAKNVETDETLVIYSKIDKMENILAIELALFTNRNLKLISSGQKKVEKIRLDDMKQAKDILYPKNVIVKKQ